MNTMLVYKLHGNLHTEQQFSNECEHKWNEFEDVHYLTMLTFNHLMTYNQF